MFIGGSVTKPTLLRGAKTSADKTRYVVPVESPYFACYALDPVGPTSHRGRLVGVALNESEAQRFLSGASDVRFYA